MGAKGHGVARNEDTMLKITCDRRPGLFWFALLTLVTALIIPALGFGQSHPGNGVPRTVQDHQALAEHYQRQATELRAEVSMHREMLKTFGEGVAKNAKAGENPYLRKMRLHCEKYIKAAETLAAEATEFGRFHTLRAKELQGK